MTHAPDRAHAQPGRDDWFRPRPAHRPETPSRETMLAGWLAAPAGHRPRAGRPTRLATDRPPGLAPCPGWPDAAGNPRRNPTTRNWRPGKIAGRSGRGPAADQRRR